MSRVIVVSPSSLFTCKVVLMDPMTVQQLVKQLKDTFIYRFPQSFCRVSSCSSCFLAEYILKLQCRDTYWVESFNHQLLCYIPKRIHFSMRVFTMRLNLAVMDWVSQSLQSSCMYQLSYLYTYNENVNHPATSTHKVMDLRCLDQRTPMKVLVNKTYSFVGAIWDACVS